MRFTFLGTGTSAGVPLIGCACDVCTSDDPRDQRLRTSAAIEVYDEKSLPRTILLDAGPDLRQQVLRFKVERCDSILFTHAHVDHIFGLDEVRRFNVVQHAPIDIYADTHTTEQLRRVYKHIFEREKNVNDSFVATLIAHRVAAMQAFALHGLRVTPIPFLHGKQPILGYRFDAGEETNVGSAASSLLPLVYATDVSAVPTETWSSLHGVRTLVLDALRHRHHPTHLTLDQSIRIAEQCGAEKTYFVHMAHDLKHEETQAGLPEGVFLAYDGLVLDDDSPRCE